MKFIQNARALGAGPSCHARSGRPGFERKLVEVDRGALQSGRTPTSGASRPPGSCLVRRDHPALPSKIKKATRVDHRTYFPEWFEGKDLSRIPHGHGRRVQVDCDDLAGFQNVTKTIDALARVEFTRRHGVAEKDS